MSSFGRYIETEMDRGVIYRRVLDICVELSRLLADINEAENSPQSSAKCQTVLLIMRQYREAGSNQNRGCDDLVRRMCDERDKAIANGTYGEDEIYTMSVCNDQEPVEDEMDDSVEHDCCDQNQVGHGTMDSVIGESSQHDSY